MRKGVVGIALGLLLAVCAGEGPASAKTDQVRIGQAVPTLSFLPVISARALNSFGPEGLSLQFASIRGGDPAALAALDSGDIDFAAVGSDTALEAIAKGQPFQIIYSLMSQVSLELVVSNNFLKRTHISPSSPLKARIDALKNAIIGVSAIGGTQDRVARWLVAQGGLNPKTDIKIAMVGPPPAIHAALEHGQIDGFVLSPPEGALAEKDHSGKVLIRLGAEFPQLRSIPYLVLVAKKPLQGAQKALAIKTVASLQAASRAVINNPREVASTIQTKFYPKLSKQLIFGATKSMIDGVSGFGRITKGQINRLLKFTKATNPEIAKKLTDTAPGGFWTDAIVDAAAKAKASK